MCTNLDLNWSKILVSFRNRKSGRGRECVTSQLEKCINLSSFKRRISCDASGSSCVSIDTSVGFICLTNFYFRCPCGIWKSKNSLLKCAETDLILKNHTQCCCAVVNPSVALQSPVPRKVTAALVTFLLSSKLFSLLQ